MSIEHAYALASMAVIVAALVPVLVRGIREIVN
jgi:hypothetical protein